MSYKYCCSPCIFNTNRLNDWNKHLLTEKHKKNELNPPVILEHQYSQVCNDCGKLYKHRQSFYRHRKTCVPAEQQMCLTVTQQQTPNKSEELMKHITIDQVLKLVQQNEDLKSLILEQNAYIHEKNNIIHEQNTQIMQQNAQLIEYCKQPKTVKNNFNLNFFLNVKCKDAVNISDFVNNLATQLSDVELVGRLGCVDGISKIILNALQELDMYKRPIHCTDPKREVLFVKDDDKWDKDQDKQKIKKAITKVAQNSCKALCDYIKPNMMDANHPDFDKNITLMRNVNGGGNNTNQDKIISIISKNVTVEKMEE